MNAPPPEHDPGPAAANAGTDARAAVEARGLRKTFGRGDAAVQALRGIDLTLPANTLTMLVGPSGCGKTTLLSILSGVLSPTEGHAEVFGTDWASLSPDGRARRRGQMVGFVFQDFNLIPTLTVRENVMVPMLVRGTPRRDARNRAANELQRVGLGDRTDDPISALSGGMQQRVAIARATVTQPRLLVCDEPTGNLDADTGQTVLRLIKQAARPADDQPDRCVVVVTHDSRIFHFADDIRQMEDGTLRDQPSDDIREQLERSRRRYGDADDTDTQPDAPEGDTPRGSPRPDAPADAADRDARPRPHGAAP